MDANLVIVGGKANRSHVSVTLPAIIGRSREADLTVAHPMVSRKHCQLYEVEGLVMIRDLGSLNGTFVDQKQISEAALHPDAEFTVGPLTFRIEYEYLVPGAAPPEVAAPELRDTEALTGAAEPPGDDRAEVPDSGEGPAAIEEALAAEVQPSWGAAEPAIAPADGVLPDLSAWGDEDVVSADQGQAGIPAPPPPPSPVRPPVAEPPPLLVEGAEDDLAETMELGGPQPVEPLEVEIAEPIEPSETPQDSTPPRQAGSNQSDEPDKSDGADAAEAEASEDEGH